MGSAVAKLFGTSRLYRCAKEGRWEEIQQLLTRGHDVNQRYWKHASTALHCAAREGHINSVRVLVVGGAEIDSKTRDGRTPLLMAAENGHSDVCRYLIERGACIEASDADGRTVLHIACFEGLSKVVESLVEKDVDVNATTDLQETALFLAALMDRPTICEILIRNGANIEAKSFMGLSPLHAAVANASLAAAKVLIEHKADVNSLDEQEQTPLHWAVLSEDEEALIDLLLRNGARLDIKNVHGLTPGKMALSKRRYVTYASLFVHKLAQELAPRVVSLNYSRGQVQRRDPLEPDSESTDNEEERTCSDTSLSLSGQQILSQRIMKNRFSML